MKILLVGSGGREHALAWRLAQSDRCSALYCAPGNAGTEECADNVAIAADDIDGLVSFAKDKEIDFVVIGPEAPLVAGLTDRLRDKKIKSFGPSAAAARLEGSKGFMKDLCQKYNVPTAAYGRFTDIDEAKDFIRAHGTPIVVKADGLAAGKGVIIAQTVEEAEQAAADMLSGAFFGDAGAEVVIEEFLDGEELSFFALSDGKTVLPLTSAQDHKQVGEGDTGPNTGGMGAYSPAHMMTRELGQVITKKIIMPVVDGMKKEKCPFQGVLFAGIMLVKGEPVLLEFNARFGDPECQALMMRLEYDVLDLLLACADGQLEKIAKDVSWCMETALCVVMAASGYPGAYKRGGVIKNIAAADIMPQTKVFHAGTKKDDQGNIIANGGRVLGVTSYGRTMEEAQERAYQAVDEIDWPGGFCRRDIGWRALKNVKEEGDIRAASTSG